MTSIERIAHREFVAAVHRHGQALAKWRYARTTKYHEHVAVVALELIKATAKNARNFLRVARGACPKCGSDDYHETGWRAPGESPNVWTLAWHSCNECGYKSEPS